MAQRRTHVQRAARLALGKHIVAAQVNLGSFTGRAQLLQVAVAELSLCVLLVTNGLRVCYPLGACGGFRSYHFCRIVHDPCYLCLSVASIQNVIGRIWRSLPLRVRRWSMRVTHARFTVTAGAIIFNDKGQVLLLKHRFRAGSGWGLPGGFLEKGEQPLDALKRELREEIGMEVETAEIFAARSFKKPRQVEILFLCHANADVKPQAMEVERAEWFSVESLPHGLPRDQRLLVERAATDVCSRARN
jgi:8-oxo-dGTP diphosphatase